MGAQRVHVGARARPKAAAQQAAPRAAGTGARRGTATPPQAGNQVMQQMLTAGLVQAKLTVNQPGDKLEQEADHVANRVMRMPEPARAETRQPDEKEDERLQRQPAEQRPEGEELSPLWPTTAAECPAIQRMCRGCGGKTTREKDDEKNKVRRQPEEENEEEVRRQPEEENEEEVQRQADEMEEEESESLSAKRAGSGATPEVTRETEARLRHSREAGQPLPEPVRSFFESRIGWNFGRVRIHSDATATDLAQQINARAFTWGRHIYFAEGAYQPQTNEGRRLLAHELTHTVQQSGPSQNAVSAPQTSGVIARQEGAPCSPGGAPAPPLAPALPVPQGEALPETPPAAEVEGEKVARPAPRVIVPGMPEPGTEPPAAPAPVGAAAPPAPAPAAPTAKPAGGAGCPQAPKEEAPEAAEPAPATAPAGEPSEVVGQLQQVSPAQRPFVFDQYAEAAQNSVAARREQEAANPPRARFRPSPSQAPAEGGPEVKPQSEGKARAVLKPLEGGKPVSEPVEEHEHAGAAPQVRGVEDPAQKIAQFPKENASDLLAWIRNWVNRFFSAVPTTDSGVNTDPGPVQQADLKGEADPKHTVRLEEEGRGRVGQQRQAADEDAQQDFGEDDIDPEMEEEDLEEPIPVQTEPPGGGCPTGESEPLNFDPEHEKELQQRVAAREGGKWDAQRLRLAEGEQERDVSITQKSEDTDREIEEAHADAYAEEGRQIGAAQKEVRRRRKEWTDRNAELEEEFDEASGELGEDARGEVAKQLKTVNEANKEHLDQTKKRAEGEKKCVEQKVEEEKAREQRSSGGWFSRAVDWVVDKVKEISRKLMKWITKAFDELRDRVSKWIDKAKKWVLDKIEQFRAWAIKKLEEFRKDLLELVDEYLGDYPAVAKRIKGAINTTIDFAQDAVNTVADGLKTAVAFWLDVLKEGIDWALGLVEGLLKKGIAALCQATVVGFRLVAAFVERDLDSLIKLVRELPEQPPLGGALMGIVKAGLLGFLECLRDQPPDRKKRYVEKLHDLMLSVEYYGGIVAGVVKGIVWDGILMTLWGVVEAIMALPELLNTVLEFIGKLTTDEEAIKAMIAEWDKVVAEVREFLAGPNAAEQIEAYIRAAPGVLMKMFDKAVKHARSWAFNAGAKAANDLYDFVLTSSDFKIGLAIGTVIGQVAVEVLLLVFTGGIGTAVKLGLRGVKWLAWAAKRISAVAKGGGAILKVLGVVGEVITFGLRAAQQLGGGLQKLFKRLRVLLVHFTNWLRRGLGLAAKLGTKLPIAKWLRRGLGGLAKRGMKQVRQFTRWLKRTLGPKKKPVPKKKPGPKRKPVRKGKPDRKKRDEKGSWGKFVLDLKGALQRFTDGISRRDLNPIFDSVCDRHRTTVVPSSRRITRDEGFWELRVRERDGVHRRLADRVLVDRDTRWKEGTDAVRERMSKVTEAEMSTEALNAILSPFIRKYRFKSLQAVWDEKEQDWNIMGEMSAKVEVDEVPDVRGLHEGTLTDPIPVFWYKCCWPARIEVNTDSGPQKVPMEGRTRVTLTNQKGKRVTHTLGVSTDNIVKTGSVLKRGSAHKRHTGQKDFRAALLHFGRDMTEGQEDADHVKDIGMGGKDNFANLWPLKQGINRRAFGKRGYYATYRVAYKVKALDPQLKRMRITREVKTISRLGGKKVALKDRKWLEIIGYQKEPPRRVGGKR